MGLGSPQPQALRHGLLRLTADARHDAPDGHRRSSKRWAYVAGIAFWIGVQMVLVTLNPATSLTTIVATCVLAGLGVSAAHVLTGAMIPDAVEWGEWKTGERNEGMLYSLTTLTRKVTASLAIPAVGLLLQVTGYEPNTAQQPEEALWSIRIAFGPLPAILLRLGILFAILYPLGREEYTHIARQLAERRASTAEETA